METGSVQKPHPGNKDVLGYDQCHDKKSKVSNDKVRSYVYSHIERVSFIIYLQSEHLKISSFLDLEYFFKLNWS